MKRLFGILVLLALVVTLGAPRASADGILDPLHGCWGSTPTNCTDNGSNTPTSMNPLTFTFTASAGPKTGDLLIEILVPAADGSGLTFTVTDNEASANASVIAGVSTSTWSSGFLDAFLGFGASPANPIGAYTVGGSSYWVYQANMGTNTLEKPSSPGGPPILSISQALPVDSYVVGFLNNGTAASPDWIATANSGALLETATPIPEPGTLTLFGTGLMGLAGILLRKLSA